MEVCFHCIASGLHGNCFLRNCDRQEKMADKRTIDMQLTCRPVTRRIPVRLKSTIQSAGHTNCFFLPAPDHTLQIHIYIAVTVIYIHTHTHLLSLVIMTHLLSDTSYQFHHGSYTFVFTIPEVTAEVDGCCNRCKSTWHRTASASEISSELSWPGSREMIINNIESVYTVGMETIQTLFSCSPFVIVQLYVKIIHSFFPLIRLHSPPHHDNTNPEF